jgi:hypothetical protein
MKSAILLAVLPALSFAANIFTFTQTSATSGTIDLEIGGSVIAFGDLPDLWPGEFTGGAPGLLSWGLNGADRAGTWGSFIRLTV